MPPSGADDRAALADARQIRLTIRQVTAGPHVGHVAAGDDDLRAGEALRLDESKQRRRVSRGKTNAAVRGRRAEPADLIAAVDRMTLLGEEDRMGHRRVVPFPRVVVLLQAEGTEAAAWRAVARGSGGY